VMQNVFIGFGSNQGDSVDICNGAIAMLRENSQIEIEEVSSFYRTKPEGLENQPWFVNGVIKCATELEPEELLRFLREVENHFGRVRRERWGPRTLDLDILTYGDRILNHDDLTIPHPRLHERRFVLVPLQEIAPDWRHPLLLASAESLLQQLAGEADNRVLRMELE
jgi:2-amino-4-hydroxy-6-hydroxymethyldihydropteridine diphosphokinase